MTKIIFLFLFSACFINLGNCDVWHYPDEQKNGQLASKKLHAMFY